MSIHAAGFSDRKVPSAVDDWTAAAGRHVAIYRNGVQVDRGQVEAITADGKILWLMQDGAQYRRIIEKVPGIELYFLEEAGACPAVHRGVGRRPSIEGCPAP